MQLVSGKDGKIFQVITEAIEREHGQIMIVYQELQSPFNIYVLEKEKFQEMLDQDLEDELPKLQDRVEIKPKRREERRPSALIEAFLDAETYNKKIEVLESVEEQIEDDTLELLALAMDVVLEGDTMDARYYSLLQVLRMRARFDIER
jgi:hypothetical protein